MQQIYIVHVYTFYYIYMYMWYQLIVCVILSMGTEPYEI